LLDHATKIKARIKTYMGIRPSHKQGVELFFLLSSQ